MIRQKSSYNNTNNDWLQTRLTTNNDWLLTMTTWSIKQYRKLQFKYDMIVNFTKEVYKYIKP